MTTPGIQTPAHSELRRFIDHVPALGWSALPDGSLEYVNQRFRDYTGLSLDELYGSGWKSAVHRDDIQPLELVAGAPAVPGGVGVRKSCTSGERTVNLRVRTSGRYALALLLLLNTMGH